MDEPVRTVPELLTRAKAFAEARGYEESYASRKIFNDGKKLKRLRGGGPIQTDTLERAFKRLDELEKEPPAKRRGRPNHDAAASAAH
jgi:hypothetical protein